MEGARQLELLLVEAANGVTPAIQGLKICSGVITPRILGGGGIYPQDSRGGYLPPWIPGGGGNNPNNPPYLRHCLENFLRKKDKLTNKNSLFFSAKTFFSDIFLLISEK